LPSGTRVIDAGCGEGVLVDEFQTRLNIVGVDPNYSSEHVKTGSLAALPFADASFDRGLCLDVLEHLTFAEQAPALAELFRVVKPGGELLVSVPNLAHLQSRVHFVFLGRLIHTANLAKHPGDRPAGEFIDSRDAPVSVSCHGAASSRRSRF
jgi:predicted SAM-dependent methyltransferase